MLKTTGQSSSEGFWGWRMTPENRKPISKTKVPAIHELRWLRIPTRQSSAIRHSGKNSRTPKSDTISSSPSKKLLWDRCLRFQITLVTCNQINYTEWSPAKFRPWPFRAGPWPPEKLWPATGHPNKGTLSEHFPVKSSQLLLKMGQ